MALNPRIKQIELGIEELNTYVLYPLSMADEFRISDIISKAAAKFNFEEDSNDVETVQLVIGVIKDNIGIILEMITKKDNRPKLSELDNVQFTELVDLIFQVNFENSIKNFQSLVARVKTMFLPTRPTQPSSEEQVTD